MAAPFYQCRFDRGGDASGLSTTGTAFTNDGQSPVHLPADLPRSKRPRRFMSKRSEATRFCLSFFNPWLAARNLSVAGRVGCAGVSAAWMPRPSPQG